MDQQVLDETQRQLDSSQAARDAAQAAVAAREADRVTSRGQPGKGQDRRGDRQGPGQGGRGRRAHGGSHAGLYQSDRSLRRRGDRPQRQHRRLRAGGDGRQVDAQAVGHLRGRPRRPGADLRGRSRGLCPLCPRGNEGRRAGRCAQRLGDPGGRHPDLVEPDGKDPDLAGGDRPADQELRFSGQGHTIPRPRTSPRRPRTTTGCGLACTSTRN